MSHNFWRVGALLLLINFSVSSCAFLTESNSRPPSASAERETRLRQDVVSYAKKYLGTKYRAGGKDPKGFDCSGFTSYVMKNFDISLPPVARYQADEGRTVSVSNVEPGDLIFFKRSGLGKVFHVALVVNNNPREGIQVIHSTSRGVVIDNISKSGYWEPKIASARAVLQK